MAYKKVKKEDETDIHKAKEGNKARAVISDDWGRITSHEYLLISYRWKWTTLQGPTPSYVILKAHIHRPQDCLLFIHVNDSFRPKQDDSLPGPCIALSTRDMKHLVSAYILSGSSM